MRKLKWSMFPAIFSLAWPTMLEQLMQTAVQYIDTAMVGSLGTDATAAVGSTTTVGWLLGSSISALGVGFLAFIAQAKGAGNSEMVLRASSQAVLVTLVTGTAFTMLTLLLSNVIPSLLQVDPSIKEIASRYFFIIYTPMLFRTAIIIFGALLRAVGDSKTPMAVGIAVNIVNVILNFLLIYPKREVSFLSFEFTLFGADMGVTGAATASAISFVVGGIIITAALWKKKELSPVGMSLKPEKEILKPCLRIALPNMLQRFGTSLGYVAFASMINSLGEISTAAHTVANTVESAFYIPGYGMQAAAATLMGNSLGANDKNKADELGRLIIFTEVLLMSVSGALLFIFAEDMVNIFVKDPEVIRLGSTVLRMVALSEPFYGVSIVVEGMLQGMGKTKAPFIFNITGMWGIRIIGTFICVNLLSFGLVSAWLCMIVHNLFLFVMFSTYYQKRKRQFFKPEKMKDTP